MLLIQLFGNWLMKMDSVVDFIYKIMLLRVLISEKKLQFVFDVFFVMDNGEDEDYDDDDGIMNFNDDYCDVLFVNLY